MQNLSSKNIKQSVGNVGCSYHNRWIVNLWKRIKYEWFTIYSTSNISIAEVLHNIDKYVEFFNMKRLSKFTGRWNIPMNIHNSYKIKW